MNKEAVMELKMLCKVSEELTKRSGPVIKRGCEKGSPELWDS